MPAQQNADFSQRFLLFLSDGVTPFSLTGYALRMDVKDVPGATPVASFSTLGANPNLAIEQPPNDNAFDLTVPASVMATFAADEYFVDVIATRGTVTLLIGALLWDVTTGITNSPTPSLPPYQNFPNGNALSSIPTSSFVLVLAGAVGIPGPPGPAFDGTFPPVPPPAAPLIGFRIYTDVNDGVLKVISSTGKITELVYPV